MLERRGAAVTRNEGDRLCEQEGSRVLLHRRDRCLPSAADVGMSAHRITLGFVFRRHFTEFVWRRNDDNRDILMLRFEFENGTEALLAFVPKCFLRDDNWKNKN